MSLAAQISSKNFLECFRPVSGTVRINATIGEALSIHNAIRDEANNTPGIRYFGKPIETRSHGVRVEKSLLPLFQKFSPDDAPLVQVFEPMNLVLTIGYHPSTKMLAALYGGILSVGGSIQATSRGRSTNAATLQAILQGEAVQLSVEGKRYQNSSSFDLGSGRPDYRYCLVLEASFRDESFAGMPEAAEVMDVGLLELLQRLERPLGPFAFRSSSNRDGCYIDIAEHLYRENTKDVVRRSEGAQSHVVWFS